MALIGLTLAVGAEAVPVQFRSAQHPNALLVKIDLAPNQ
jgi:hypothetical protein